MCSLSLTSSMTNEQVGGTAPIRLNHAPSARLHEVDPINDPRWEKFVCRHRYGSLFHSAAWLGALHETYGYRPVAFTRSTPDQVLTNGFVFCEIDSWLTGRRLVSVPFSDYCESLCSNQDDLPFFVGKLKDLLRNGRWRYIEFRTAEQSDRIANLAQLSAEYTLHRLDLGPDLATILANFHHSSIQRKIKRAEREGIDYEEGASESLLNAFYPLLVTTRQRHRVPPQPKKWFRSLIDRFGGDLKIRIASQKGRPLACMLTIRYKDEMYYKYGGSDGRFNHLGGMQYLYWQAIQDAKQLDLQTFDLGRSDMDQPGLITFKNRWGAQVSSLKYYRFPRTEPTVHFFEPRTGLGRRALGSVFAWAPARVLPALGAALYKHVG